MRQRFTFPKRIGAAILAVAVVGQPLYLAPVQAVEKNTVPAESRGGNYLEVDVRMDLPTKNKQFDFKLTKDGTVRTDRVPCDENGKIVEATFDGLTAGEYLLEVSADGYADYSQKVTVSEGYTSEIQLHNNAQINELVQSGSKYGIMAVGDVTEDGKIDKADSEAMMNAIESGENDTHYDLNGDGRTDAADLTYITMNYGGNVEAQVLSRISADNIDPEMGSGSIKSGDLRILAEGGIDEASKTEKFVQFASANGAPVSETNPIEFSMEIKSPSSEGEGSGENPPENAGNVIQGIVIRPPVDSDNLIRDAVITVEGENGETYDFTVGEGTVSGGTAEVRKTSFRTVSAARSSNGVTVENDGTIVVNLGEKIAVKRVVIRVTGAGNSLVDIAKVEFLNDMEARIPEPQLNIPNNLGVLQTAYGKEPKFQVSWEKQQNVTGYEVSVSAGGQETITKTSQPPAVISSLNGKLKYYQTYTVRVRSVNGDWRSPYSESRTITLKPDSAPAAPEGVSLTAKVDAIQVSWKAMDGAQYYRLYYKAATDAEYELIDNIQSNSYTLESLTPNLAYTIYVVAVNEKGASPQSELKTATPIEAKALQMPGYKRINVLGSDGKPKHVENIDLKAYTADAPWVIMDDNLDTFAVRNSWDSGGYNKNNGWAPVITLDQEYEIDTLRFAPRSGQGDYPYIKAYCWDASGNITKVVDSQFNTNQKKTDANGNQYYELKFSKTKAKKVQICVANYSASGNNTIAEVGLYYYDSIADEIDALYTDSMHIELREGVDEQTIASLRERLDIRDEVSGELHPDRDFLLKDLEYAQTLLQQKGLAEIVPIDTNVTAKADGHLDFAYTLSDLQPLGCAAKPGDKIVVYVGSPGKSDGASTNLRLIATQNHAEWSAWKKDCGVLKVGRNEITVPDVAKKATEAGGSLYVSYTGNKGSEQYSVRVSGAAKIPVLNVAGKSGEERMNAIQTYVAELETYAADLNSGNAHKSAGHTGDYNAKECFLNYTDIVFDNMMYSVPASQVLAALNTNDKAEQLKTAIEAMEQEVDLFYQHKGFSKKAGNGDSNRYPSQRLNIRYHTMFSGAFMYAVSQHIGIEYGSAGELFKLSPVQTDEQGNKLSGQLSGWGIAHEIGHVINNNKYATAEVTNNYYSILSTGDVRSNYEGRVYPAVTGKSADGATELAMYWQLHMFYDQYGDYKMFDEADAQLENLFFARMDAYSRKPASAPTPEEGTALTLCSSKTDNLVRLACAAAQKDLTDFFDAWGKHYNKETEAYAEQFPKETHKIQYFSPAARKYKLAGGSGMPSGTVVTTDAENGIQYKNGSNQVTLNLGCSADADDMLGYEIIRNGEAVAFVPAGTSVYTDTVTTGNNRVYDYEIIAYDKLLNATEVKKLKPVKVSHDGSIDRDTWTVTTNMTSEDDENIKADGNNGYCEDTYISAIGRIIGQNAGIGGDSTKGYTGKLAAASSDKKPDGYADSKETEAQFTINLGKSEQITALKYRGDAAGFTIKVSGDGESWTDVQKGTFKGGNEEQTVYFNKADQPGYLNICDASHVRVVFDLSVNQNITIHDVNLLGPTGDNIEWLAASEGAAAGKLAKDYTYGSDADDIIPANSIVFTGTYKGNPAYNVVLLKDENGRIIEGSQIILADDPKNGELGDVSDGTWIYWIEQADNTEQNPLSGKKVKAELYRVDNAMTLEGERLVSDALYISVPDQLPSISLQGGVAKAAVSARNVSAGDAEVKTASNSGMLNTGALLYSAPQEVQTYRLLGTENSVVRTQTVRAGVAAPGENSETAGDGNAGKAAFRLEAEDNGTKANIAFDLGQNELTYTLAMQASFDVPEGITGASMDWSEVVKDRALLRECRFDKENRRVWLFITSKTDLEDNGVITLGTIGLKYADGVKEAELKLTKGETVTVDSTFASSAEKWDTLEDAAIVLRAPDSSSSSGSGSGSGSGNTDNNKPGTDDNTDKPSVSKGDVSDVFNDVEKDAWYYSAVQQAYDNGWFNGTSADTFAPENTMTRGMFVTVLGRFAGASQMPSGRFSDVAADMYYAGYVAWAASQNIVEGVAEDEFAPEASITREQMAAMIYRYLTAADLKLDSVNDQKAFTDDAKISPWARDAVYAMQKIGLISGMDDGSFQPDQTATRAQVATILMNLKKKIG